MAHSLPSRYFSLSSQAPTPCLSRSSVLTVASALAHPTPPTDAVPALRLPPQLHIRWSHGPQEILYVHSATAKTPVCLDFRGFRLLFSRLLSFTYLQLALAQLSFCIRTHVSHSQVSKPLLLPLMSISMDGSSSDHSSPRPQDHP